MDRIGLDFGTTNTTLCYMEKGEPIPFKYGGEGGQTYIPSYLAIDKADPKEKSIGPTALDQTGDLDYRIFNRFKMLLNATEDEAKERGFDNVHTPRKITTWFFEKLLTAYRDQKNVPRLKSFVITIPEVWMRGDCCLAARETLKEICKMDLKLPLAKILTEPEAACVYFAWKHKQQSGRSFDGHILVFDYGGGTLDLNLARLEGEKITILDGVGVGRLKDGKLGKAGVAYDEAVLSALYSVAGRQHDAVEWARFLLEFEGRKIVQKDKVGKRLEQFIIEPESDRKIFPVGDMEVSAGLLTNAFAPFRKEIEKNLLEMDKIMKLHKVDKSNGDAFRVLMVGGFSQFYLAARTVKEFFKLESSADRRFNSGFDLADTALAIAKGAALVAAEAYEIERLCPISVGIQVLKYNKQKEDVTILHRGQKLSEYKNPVFGAPVFQVSDAQTEFNLFFETANGGRPRLTLGKIEQFFPDDHLTPIPGTHNLKCWKFGFSVDEDGIFSMHIHEYDCAKKEILSNKKTTPLGDLEQQLKGIFIVEE